MNAFLRLFLLFITLLTGLPGPASYAQFSEIDSLKRRLIDHPADTNRVIILNKLAFAYLYSKPDTTHRLAQQAYKLAQQLGYLHGQARGLDVMGTAMANLGDYPKAIRLYQQSLTISRSISDLNSISVILNNLVTPYAAQKQYDLAIRSLRASIQMLERANPSTAHTDTMAFGTMYCNLGEIFALKHQLDSASHYLLKALPLAQRGATRVILSNILYVLGDVQKLQGNTRAALAYYYRAVSIATETNTQISKADTYLRIAQIFQQTGQVDSSIVNADKSLITSQESSYLSGILPASQLLAQLYEGRDNTQALRYYKVAVAAKDSLFSQEKVKQLLTLDFEEQQRQQELAAAEEIYQNRIRTYGLSGLVAVVLLVAGLLWRTTQRQRRSNHILSRQKTEIEHQRSKAEQTLQELQTTQTQLIQQEKMASLGELTAGIAHEIQNPLNFVNNFAEVSTELVDELAEEYQKPTRDTGLETDILADLRQNLRKINQHGKRADAIVKGMLAHSRPTTGIKQVIDLNSLANEYLHLAYHGLRAKDKEFNVSLMTDLDETMGRVEVIPQDIGRVLLNLYNNAFYAVQQKQQQRRALAGSANGTAYEPTVWVRTRREADQVVLEVEDNGTGMPESVQAKIFQPFFTTKPTGEGTGLGLSLSYDMVTKSHGGMLSVVSEPGEFTRMQITLPLAATPQPV